MKIGLIGDHITDIYVHGKMNRFSPESPIPIFDITHVEERAGGASNVNNNLIALGAYCHYFYDGINYSVKRRYVCDNHIMFRCDEDKISEADCLEYVFPEETKYVILSDYNKGLLNNSEELIQSLKKDGKIIVVDAKKPIQFYEGADIVKMNEKEFAMFCPKGDHARKYYGIGTIVVTLGGRGVKIFSDEGISTIPGINSKVADVTGAGDIFIAAMTYFLAKDDHIYDACVKANQLAALSVGHFGTYTLTPEDVKKVNKKIVFTNGCFDIIHKGHIEYLQKSKALGDYLIVGLNSDSSVKKLKGKDRPMHNHNDRRDVLLALECVDEVIIFDEDTPYDLIKDIKPDIITKGGDYKTVEEVVGNDLAEVVLIPFVEGHSTTNILEYLNGDC